jgi:hypothetical protein
VVGFDLTRGPIDDDGVVKVIDQIAPFVEITVFDREIVEGVEDHLRRAIVEVEQDASFPDDLDPMQ